MYVLALLEKHYFIEVTSAISPNDYLKREALSRYGSVFGGDNIYRVRENGDDQIISKAVAEDGDAEILKASDWINKQLKAKAKKTYPSPCLLLIQVEGERPLHLREWAKVAENAQGEVNRKTFVATYLISAWRNVVIPI